jgi:hypothetical protein
MHEYEKLPCPKLLKQEKTQRGIWVNQRSIKIKHNV